MIKILFICHGNICRSPMGEFILKDMANQRGIADEFSISSCATSAEEIGNDMHPGAKRKLREMNVPFSRRQARQLTRRDYENNDYLLCMDRANIRNSLRRVKSDPEEKLHMLLEYAGENRDIADPWYTGNFDPTYDDLLKGCKAFLEYLGY